MPLVGGRLSGRVWMANWSFYTEVEETDDRQVCAAEERETQTPPKEKERAFGKIAWRNKRKSTQPEPDYDTTAA